MLKNGQHPYVIKQLLTLYLLNLPEKIFCPNSFCTVRLMTSHIFGLGDSLTLWRSGRVLAKGAGSPGFKSRQRNRKVGLKNKSLRETFGLRVIWGP